GQPFIHPPSWGCISRQALPGAKSRGDTEVLPARSWNPPASLTGFTFATSLANATHSWRREQDYSAPRASPSGPALPAVQDRCVILPNLPLSGRRFEPHPSRSPASGSFKRRADPDALILVEGVGFEPT